MTRPEQRARPAIEDQPPGQRQQTEPTGEGHWRRERKVQLICNWPSVIFFAAICWVSSIKADQTDKEGWLCTGDCSEAPRVGCGEDDVAQAAQHNGHYTTHPLHNLLIRQQNVFSQRLLQLCCNKDRYRRSFLPTAKVIYNDPSAGRGDSSEWQCTMYILHLMCTLIAVSCLNVHYIFILYI